MADGGEVARRAAAREGDGDAVRFRLQPRAHHGDGKEEPAERGGADPAEAVQPARLFNEVPAGDRDHIYCFAEEQPPEHRIFFFGCFH